MPVRGKPKGITMRSTKSPAEIDTAVKPDREHQRHRGARPYRHRELRGFWRTTLALIAPLPGLLMAVKIMIYPFGVENDLQLCWKAYAATRRVSSWRSGSAWRSRSLFCRALWPSPGPRVGGRPGWRWRGQCLV